MTHSPLTWILAADDARAHVFAKERDHLTPVLDLAAYDEAEIELTNKSVGRTASSPAKRHKYEPSMEQSRQRATSFARRIASVLKDSALQGKYESLVIAAAPSMLGYLREQLDEHTKERLIATVGKELAHLPEPDLMARLMVILQDPDIISGRTERLH